MVMEVVEEEMGEEGSNIQCADHHFKNGSSPGGICALCLQEKLGKLATSSFPEPISLSSSSSSMSPLIKSRSDHFGSSIETNASSSSTSSHMGLGSGSSNDSECHRNHRRRAKFPFSLSHGKKKKKDSVAAAATRGDTSSIVFQRSKSTATHRTGFNLKEANEDHSQERKGFWSFLYLPSTKHSTTAKATIKSIPNTNPTLSTHETNKEELVVVEENESLDEAAFENKVSRSRSIACGSRSFSGDLFGRLSTGFGDCTLRRVESHREGKNKLHSMHRNSITGGECMKQRVKCGGIFSGFMIASSSTSSSYCISSADDESATGKTTATPGRRDLSNGR